MLIYLNKDWKKKEEIAIFRGGATGCGLDIETNPRLMVCYLSTKNPELLDAGITDFNAKGKKYSGKGLSVIDIKKKKVIDTVKVGQRPRGIIMSKDGKLVLICASDDDRVEVRDAKTMKLKYHLPSGPDPELFILSPDDDTLYIANEDDAMVTVVDMNDKMIIDDIPVGVEPEGMGLTNNGKLLVNTSETTNMAHFINAETLEIVENVAIEIEANVHNERYLKTKRDKMGHLLKMNK